MSKLLVSIVSITYNHEKYIAQAIDSFLMQETNFDFEIIIGEDCSTDNTLEIIKEYKAKHPDKIELITSENNVGMMPNFIRTLEACKGKYIALCEGDDYWTDPLKLQKQVDFLEANDDYSICFHSVKVLSNDKLINDTITKEVPENTDILDLAKGNYIHTPSVVFRNNKFPTWLKDLPIGDYPLHLYNAQFGKIKKMDNLMAVYRVHPGGVHSMNNPDSNRIKWLFMLGTIAPFFEESIKRELEKSSKAIMKQLLFNDISQSLNKDLTKVIVNVYPNFIKDLIMENENNNLKLLSRKHAIKLLISSFKYFNS